ncbi:hypothetical protein NMY22_g16267 [Coprinellus aureogranulatus]|nr:hypothetical protein NMY22_g16267 [Coprinellus aureogranulatus]
MCQWVAKKQLPIFEFGSIKRLAPTNSIKQNHNLVCGHCLEELPYPTLRLTMGDAASLHPSLPRIHVGPSPFAVALRFLAKILPPKLKCKLYNSLFAWAKRRGWGVHPLVCHLPLGIALKTTKDSPQDVDASALRFLESRNISGLNYPCLIDYTAYGGQTHMLSTFIAGDNVSSVLEHFSLDDWMRLEIDVQQQLRSLRRQTSTSQDSLGYPAIANAAGGIINDPRISWVAEEGLEVRTTEDFLSQVWPGLDLPHNQDTIRPTIQPLIKRPVPVAFCHGDVYPRNMILPGGLAAWREGKSRICFIDWEFSGWMPEPWEALKATWIEYEEDTEWMVAVRNVMPEFKEYLQADWIWRTQSNMMLI